MGQEIWLERLGEWVWLEDVVKESGLSRVAVWQALMRLKKRRSIRVDEINACVLRDGKIVVKKLVRVRKITPNAQNTQVSAQFNLKKRREKINHAVYGNNQKVKRSKGRKKHRRKVHES